MIIAIIAPDDVLSGAGLLLAMAASDRPTLGVPFLLKVSFPIVPRPRPENL